MERGKTAVTNELETITEQVRVRFEAIDEAREKAYKRSRDVIRLCATAIRAVHREEWEKADALLADTRASVQILLEVTRPYPPIYHAGYTQDCLKEYVEAELVYALVRQRPLKSFTELQVEPATWINGLAEAATELRRRILDITRHNHTAEAERLLDRMDEIYSILVTLDFRDAITGGLRRRTDTVRAVLERTRGDMTTSWRQNQLEKALANFQKEQES